MKIKGLLLFASVLLLVLTNVLANEQADGTPKPRAAMTADHSKFEQLDQAFDYAPDVTEACLECHTEAAEQVHDSFHWRWAAKVDGKMVGKGENGFNNYCVAARGNESCTQCHAGYGWRNDKFDFEAEENVDCLVCHDTTGTYKKSAAMSGHPYYEDTLIGGQLIPAVDLRRVAQNVGQPQRENCLSCHANGGGGNGVKHGDTDMSLVDPVHELDVHMSSDKLNFSCQTCHKTSGHEIAGRYNGKVAFVDHQLDMGRAERDGKNLSCESCHGNKPHDQRQLDNHTAKVACASCHIPEMARGPHLTKLSWDWSTAGQLKDGKPFSEDALFDGVEAHRYMSKKGTFTWGKNVVPEYRWYKGELQQKTLQDVIDPMAAPIDINPPTGDYRDQDARIWPFKIHRGKQPYDTEFNRILPIKLYGKKGSGAFWTEFDWQRALQVGADNNHVEFSGSYGFIETNGYWPIKHMVAPGEQAVDCIECHQQQGRLAGLNDFYLLGRDSHSLVDAFGALAIFGGLFGVAGHSGYRYLSARRRAVNNAKTS
ncbi:tetrathionate reductase family octaheme c-type cytochrome [Corallincola luteus]|uniref:Tetrathionate reductase family octaheme c-type cytochrome n=1 Tax=Corallincola luteus TaxID=1775177 RepID=A0ABY2ANC3_9GAMM|nr:tetrathionate reductase family octaheme c-type cytochrome [Corallincola luteus]TCI04691.1 tetrathionate reductase family octaheme c-type cytochrome [Corallincola luteus]